MSNYEEWNEFLGNLLSNAVSAHRATKEYEYQRQRKEEIDKFMSANLTPDQKDYMDEILFELGLAAERETEVVYRQGFKDCVGLLKSLNVLPG